MAEHGLIASYHDYRRLPAGVLFDARQWMEADLAHRAKQAAAAAREVPRGRRR